MSTTTTAPQLKSVRAHGTWQGQMRTENRIRAFTVRTDEPTSLGGTDQAPTPMELVASAVNGCLTVVIETVAAELGLTLDSLEVSSHARMDVRGFQGTADVSPHFQEYTLTVTLEMEGDVECRDDLVRLSEKRCPAINLVRDAGVNLTVDWRFLQPG